MTKATMLSEFCFATKVKNIHTGEIHTIMCKGSLSAGSGLFISDNKNVGVYNSVDFHDYVPVEYFHQVGGNNLQVSLLSINGGEDQVLYADKVNVTDTAFVVKGISYLMSEYSLLSVKARKPVEKIA